MAGGRARVSRERFEFTWETSWVAVAVAAVAVAVRGAALVVVWGGGPCLAAGN